MSKSTYKATQMRKLVAYYHESNQSIRAFAEAHAISKGKLSYWVGKFPKKQTKGTPNSGTSNFVRVSAPEKPESTPGSMYIRLKGGVEIEIPLSCLP